MRNNIGAVTTYSKTTMASGGWHRVVLHAVAGDGTGRLDVSVDGAAVRPQPHRPEPSAVHNVSRQDTLGDTATAATFDLILDDIVVSTSVP